MRFIYTKAFAIFSACVVCAALLAVLQFKGWLGPLRILFLEAPRPITTLAEDVTSPVKNFFFTIYSLRDITNQNSQLKSQVSALQQQLVEYQQQSRENDALRAELGFVQDSKQPLLPCSVLSQNPFGLTDALVLNCGDDEGVQTGEAVVSQGYLAGKIIFSSAHTSTVLLVTDANFSTDARVSQTNVTAIVKGSFGSGIILDQVPQTSSLQMGWLIVTAGINAQIPKGILIGQVGAVLSGSSDLFKQAALTSPIDFNNLQFVFVVKN